MTAIQHILYSLVSLRGIAALSSVHDANMQQAQYFTSLVQADVMNPGSGHALGHAELGTVEMKVHDPNPCAICLGHVEGGAHDVKTSCGHVFHKRCLQKWLNVNNFCPLCRKAHPWSDFAPDASPQNFDHDSEGEKLNIMNILSDYRIPETEVLGLVEQWYELRSVESVSFPEVDDYGNTSLMLAMMRPALVDADRKSITEILLQSMTSDDHAVENKLGLTPLIIAVGTPGINDGNVRRDIVRMLLNKMESDPGAIAKQNQFKETALMLAIHTSNIIDQTVRKEIVRMLLEKMQDRPEDIAKQNQYEETAFSISIRTSSITDEIVRKDIVGMLLEKMQSDPGAIARHNQEKQKGLMIAVDTPSITNENVRKEIVRMLLEKMKDRPEDIAKQNQFKETALAISIRTSSIRDEFVRKDIVGMLLEKMKDRPEDIAKQNQYEETALAISIRTSCIRNEFVRKDIVGMLLEKMQGDSGAIAKHNQEKQTSLMNAVDTPSIKNENVRKDIVRMLLEKMKDRPEDIAKQNKNQETALMIAVHTPSITDETVRKDIVGMLLEKMQSDPGSIAKQNQEKETALMMAVRAPSITDENVREEIVRMLLDKMQGRPENVAKQNKNQETALMLAMYTPSIKNEIVRKDIVRMLLDAMKHRPEDIAKQNKNKVTALMLAMYTPSITDENVREEIVRMLLAKMQNDPGSIAKQNKNKDTALMFAVHTPSIKNQTVRKEIVRMLLDAMQNDPGSIEKQNQYEQTALMIAVYTPSIKDETVRKDIVGMLLDKMKDHPEAITKQSHGYTALMLAAAGIGIKQKNIGIVRMLLKAMDVGDLRIANQAGKDVYSIAVDMCKTAASDEDLRVSQEILVLVADYFPKRWTCPSSKRHDGESRTVNGDNFTVDVALQAVALLMKAEKDWSLASQTQFSEVLNSGTACHRDMRCAFCDEQLIGTHFVVCDHMAFCGDCGPVVASDMLCRTCTQLESKDAREPDTNISSFLQPVAIPIGKPLKTCMIQKAFDKPVSLFHLFEAYAFDVNAIMPESRLTPLSYVCKFASSNANALVVAKLLLNKAAADPNVQDATGNNALMHACESGAPLDIIDLLVQKGANPGLTNHDKKKALYILVSRILQKWIWNNQNNDQARNVFNDVLERFGFKQKLKNRCEALRLQGLSLDDHTHHGDILHGKDEQLVDVLRMLVLSGAMPHGSDWKVTLINDHIHDARSYVLGLMTLDTQKHESALVNLKKYVSRGDFSANHNKTKAMQKSEKLTRSKEVYDQLFSDCFAHAGASVLQERCEHWNEKWHASLRNLFPWLYGDERAIHMVLVQLTSFGGARKDGGSFPLFLKRIGPIIGCLASIFIDGRLGNFWIQDGLFKQLRCTSKKEGSNFKSVINEFRQPLPYYLSEPGHAVTLVERNSDGTWKALNSWGIGEWDNADYKFRQKSADGYYELDFQNDDKQWGKIRKKIIEECSHCKNKHANQKHRKSKPCKNHKELKLKHLAWQASALVDPPSRLQDVTIDADSIGYAFVKEPDALFEFVKNHSEVWNGVQTQISRNPESNEYVANKFLDCNADHPQLLVLNTTKKIMQYMKNSKSKDRRGSLQWYSQGTGEKFSGHIDGAFRQDRKLNDLVPQDNSRFTKTRRRARSPPSPASVISPRFPSDWSSTFENEESNPPAKRQKLESQSNCREHLYQDDDQESVCRHSVNSRDGKRKRSISFAGTMSA